MRNLQFFLLSIVSTTSILGMVFLDRSQICTLKEVGSVPAANTASVNYPVFQKFCREIIPTMLGDATSLDDEKEDANDEISSKSDDKVDQITRALLSSQGGHKLTMSM
jgi:hypothetical protein